MCLPHVCKMCGYVENPIPTVPTPRGWHRKLFPTSGTVWQYKQQGFVWKPTHVTVQWEAYSSRGKSSRWCLGRLRNGKQTDSPHMLGCTNEPHPIFLRIRYHGTYVPMI